VRTTCSTNAPDSGTNCGAKLRCLVTRLVSLTLLARGGSVSTPRLLLALRHLLLPPLVLVLVLALPPVLVLPQALALALALAPPLALLASPLTLPLALALAMPPALPLAMTTFLTLSHPRLLRATPPSFDPVRWPLPPLVFALTRLLPPSLLANLDLDLRRLLAVEVLFELLRKMLVSLLSLVNPLNPSLNGNAKNANANCVKPLLLLQ
jgi:hypothetical protein